jgi:predicted glutamine amidotransferase
MAYRGQPLRIEELLYETQHSLIEQSRHAQLGLDTVNGDGFGLGWDGDAESPGLYRSLTPAWSNENLRSLAGHISSPLFLAHVRATTGTAVQETNCHPFRHGDWLFQHNGAIAGYADVRRELVLAIAPEYFNAMLGTTDSEVMFLLALSFGLDDEPLPALERMAGFVEATGRAHGIEHPLQMTLAVSDGARLYAVRYSSVGRSRTLYSSAEADALRLLHHDDRVVVSEPLTDLPGVWNEVPEATALIVQDGPDEQRPFTPRA